MTDADRYGKCAEPRSPTAILAWRGIPYARAAGRRAAAAAAAAARAVGRRQGRRSRTGTGRCSRTRGPPVPALPPVSEDCLYLNVTAPARRRRPGRPVLLWIHGGGYEMGHGPDQAGDGAAFARSHGLVVVTFNYRLGALGFLDVPGEQPTGALGLHDQIAALRWTRENIAAFGGDPDQITVYGLSAGGKSVTNLLASPLATRPDPRGRRSPAAATTSRTRPQAARLAAQFFARARHHARSGSGPSRRPTSSPRSSPSRRRRAPPGSGGRPSTAPR